MSDKADVERILDQFFQAIRDRNMSRLPLSDQVSYSGTMLPKAAEGAEAVRKHMSETAPFIKSFEVGDSVIESNAAAVLVQYEAINNVHFEGCYFIDVENGRIARIRAIVDSGPLMQGRPGS